MKHVNCIMLIDDNKDDNYFHERTIRKSGLKSTIIKKESALEALEYLKAKHEHPDEHPDLIFLDINMPGMDGWEFLEEYNNLDKELQGHIVVTMLTTSENPDDEARARTLDIVAEFKTKPLTYEILEEITEKYF